jgi:hypothetical protein
MQEMTVVKATKGELDDPEPNAIALASDARKLGEFIASLLGQPRRLSRTFDVTFLIDWNWIRNLDQLITQRVEHQNDGMLVDFSFKLFLGNGRITHLTSRTDFNSFRDLSSFEAVGIDLIWTFVVKFPTSSTPEKQEIRFQARTEDLERKERKLKNIGFFESVEARDESMCVEILYSNITWGEDLLQLVSGHVSSSFAPSSKMWRKLSNMSIRLAAPIVTLLFMVSLMVQMSGLEFNGYRAIKSLKNTTDAASVDIINKKVDILIQYEMGKAFIMPTIITVCGAVLVILGFGMIEYVLPRSYLLVNDFTEGKRKRYLARKNIVLVGTILSLFIGTLSSILATYITNYFVN